MIDSVSLVFAAQPPDLSSRGLVELLRQVGAHNAWVRWSALILGVLALGGPIALYAKVYSPMLLGEASSGHVTTAGHLFFLLLAVLGIVALSFSARLFQDVAPYRVDAERLAKMQLARAEVIDFGPWLTVGSGLAKYQRLILREQSGRELRTPYIRLIEAIWVGIGDTAYLASDPSGVVPPFFVGVARDPPDVVVGGNQIGSRAYYEALDAHLSSSSPKRRETLLKMFGAGRR